MRHIKSWKWEYLLLATVIFCEISVMLFAFMLDPAGYDPVLYLREGTQGFVCAVILVPIVLVSLKMLKSYLALAILSAAALIARALLLVYAVDSVDLTANVGGKIIYQNGDFITLGWVRLIATPFFMASILSLYLFVRENFKKNHIEI